MSLCVAATLRHAPRLLPKASAQLRLASTSSNFVKIVEVGPRDGLQNEPRPISLEDKIELIRRLGEAGVRNIESGSFVSPKWVPQMAGTADVLKGIAQLPGVLYPVLVPNAKGLSTLLSLLSSSPPPTPTSPPLTSEIAIFVAASETFSKANINCTIAESLARLAPVVSDALAAGLKVRGYVSTVITCPYEGAIEPSKVRDVSKELADLGCYEISLGDTVGTGTPKTMEDMLNSVIGTISVDKLAAHNHDTFGMGVTNVMTAINAGIRTIDSSVSGLGGCPYSPGATGNVATEDIVHALHGSGFNTNIDLAKLVETGEWISNVLGKRNESRAGVAYLAKARRERKKIEKAKL